MRFYYWKLQQSDFNNNNNKNNQVSSYSIIHSKVLLLLRLRTEKTMQWRIQVCKTRAFKTTMKAGNVAMLVFAIWLMSFCNSIICVFCWWNKKLVSSTKQRNSQLYRPLKNKKMLHQAFFCSWKINTLYTHISSKH